MDKSPEDFIPLHGPMMTPRNPRATLICFALAAAVTAAACFFGM